MVNNNTKLLLFRKFDCHLAKCNHHSHHPRQNPDSGLRVLPVTAAAAVVEIVSTSHPILGGLCPSPSSLEERERERERQRDRERERERDRVTKHSKIRYIIMYATVIVLLWMHKRLIYIILAALLMHYELCTQPRPIT